MVLGQRANLNVGVGSARCILTGCALGRALKESANDGESEARVLAPELALSGAVWEPGPSPWPDDRVGATMTAHTPFRPTQRSIDAPTT